MVSRRPAGERQWAARLSTAPATWQCLTMIVVLALMALLRWTHPSAYLAGDKLNQYVPVLQDIGRRLRAGDFPVMDPDLGTGGNYALDTQYGVYDPAHLGIAYVLSWVDDRYLAGWLLAAPFLVILAWGTCALAQRLGVIGVWSAAAGVTAATSGYVFFQLAPVWWPGLVGAAFLPWVWWSWVGVGRARQMVAIALFSYLVVASGWPAAWLAYAALSAGLLVEATSKARDQAVGVRGRAFLARVLAAAAGVAAGAVHVVPILRASDWTSRESGISNEFTHTPNLADVFSFAVPYLHGDITQYHDAPTVELPIFFVSSFLLLLAWGTAWSGAVWKQPGTVTAGVALVLALLFTQLPSELGPIRVHVRELAAVQFFAVVLVMVAWSRHRTRLTRQRSVGALTTYLAMSVVAWSRTPQDEKVLVGVALGLIALLTVLLVVHRAGLAWAGAAAVLSTCLLPVAAMHLEHPGGSGPDAVVRQTALSLPPGEGPGYALLATSHVEVPPSWAEEGVGWGFSGLTAENRYAPGYSSVRQRWFDERFELRGALGKTGPGGPSRLFSREKTTGLRWTDLLGYRALLVHRLRLPSAVQAADGDWAPVAESKDFVKLEPVAGRPGGPMIDRASPSRVTAVVGDVDVRPVAVGGERQTYAVRAPSGGRLIFRDLYWPGYVATVDGAPVPVTPFRRTLVSVELPAGAEGMLEVHYRPHSPGSLTATLGGGAVLLVASLMMAGGRRRSRRQG